MFDGAPTTEALAQLLPALSLAAPDATPAERIDRLRLLEELRGAICAAQARETAAFVADRRAAARNAGVREERAEQGLVAEVALARRCSPHQGRRLVGFATIVTRELPETLAALSAGRTTEWRAMLVAQHTGWLSPEHRTAVDGELGPVLDQLGDREVESRAKLSAYRLDPYGAVRRCSQATRDRRVSLRPAPDTMTWLTALLPVAQGVAAYNALSQAADRARAGGDERTRGQVMADTVVERLTGQARADQVPLTVDLLVPAAGLVPDGGVEPPAVLEGVGPIPAPVARRLIAQLDDDTPIWWRRVFIDPAGALVTMETRSRCFLPTQRDFLRLRDQLCRTPYCGAPVRHIDHADAAAADGPTSLDNGQGLCEACNYAKQAPGWEARATAAGAVVTTTPTGHRYESRPPPAPGGGPIINELPPAEGSAAVAIARARSRPG
jgi:hypothetical protein